MAPRPRHRTAHEQTIVRLYRVLLGSNPSADIQINSAYRKKRHAVPNTNIYPDVLDYTNLVAYEVHWAGQRKEAAFDLLPHDWRGVNVFIVDIWQTDDVYVFALDGRYIYNTSEDWVKADD